MPSKPRRSLRSFAARISPLVLAALTLASIANAQQQPVSDADRLAARELAMQGLQLQQAGNFADALDRFDRAQAVFSAPTHLLHIAQCEVALGKLVEAAETYGGLIRMNLSDPALPPPPRAFLQAQQQGTTELALLQPRIPAIKIIVRPRSIAGTKLKIDDHDVSDALVGVARPTDPGPHTVVLLAPGYARAEQRIVLNEKEIKDVAFNLGGATGAYAPPPAASEPTPTYPQAPAPAPQPFYPAPTEGFPPAAPEKHEAKGGFMLGGTVGVLIPTGNAFQGTPIGTLAGPGPSIGLDGGFRFVKRLYIGLTFEHAFLSSGSTLNAFPVGSTANADSNYIGVDFAFISNPDGTAFYGKIGGGVRYLELGVTGADGTQQNMTLSGGGELSLSAGLQLKLGAWVRLIPEASVNVGSFGSANCSPQLASSSTSSLGSECGSITNGDTHEFILLGAKLFIDFARKN